MIQAILRVVTILTTTGTQFTAEISITDPERLLESFEDCGFSDLFDFRSELSVYDVNRYPFSITRLCASLTKTMLELNSKIINHLNKLLKYATKSFPSLVLQ